MIANADSTSPAFGKGQWLHFISLAILLSMTAWIWVHLNQPHPFVFWIAVTVPVAHQVYVWLAWRLELRSAALSKTIGFRGYSICFFILFAGRFISLMTLAWLDRGSLRLPSEAVLTVTLLLMLPGLYAMYSVQRYFGMPRASGADHFDPQYRDMPLVKEGIFRFTNNGMYIYAFLLFWAVATGCNSSAALLVAAFSHAYIWVHYYATEKPDMKYLYSRVFT